MGAALQQWSLAFYRRHGRPPTFWFDKCCIDQTDIQRDLQCLPVFLCACNSLLILDGSTYSSRLWCVLELYVYFLIRSSWNASYLSMHLILLGDPVAQKTARDAWTNFDAKRCNCFDPDDMRRTFAVIESGRGGIEGFNRKVQRLMRAHVSEFCG